MNTVAPLRVAVVGTGMIATVHARSARAAGATVVGVLGRTPERSAEFAATLGGPGDGHGGHGGGHGGGHTGGHGDGHGDGPGDGHTGGHAGHGIRGYADMDELLADRPDVVHICTPNHQHHPQALAAIRAGIHVVCEKPLALDAAQAGELVAAAAEAGVVATVPFAYRYHPMVREIRARIAAGELGRVLAIHGSYLQDWMLDEGVSSWRVDAGAGGASRAFADIGSHWCDLVEFVTGERFASVSAVTDIVYPTRPAASGPSFAGAPAADPPAAPPSEDTGSGDTARSADTGRSGGTGPVPQAEVTTEDTAVATFRTAAGRIGNVVISQVSSGRKNRLWFEVDGSLGSAAFDQEQPESAWFGTETGATIVVRDPSQGSPEQRRLAIVPSGHPQGYLDAFAAFVADTYDAVRGGSPEGLPTFADGARAARIIDAVVASAGTTNWKDI